MSMCEKVQQLFSVFLGTLVHTSVCARPSYVMRSGLCCCVCPCMRPCMRGRVYACKTASTPLIERSHLATCASAGPQKPPLCPLRALWSKTTKNLDVSTRPLACPFSHLFVRLTHSLAPHLLYFLCVFRCAHSFARSLNHSFPSSWDSE